MPWHTNKGGAVLYGFSHNQKNGELGTGFPKRQLLGPYELKHHKGVFLGGAYLLLLLHDQPVGVCYGRLTKGGLRCGHRSAQKRGS